MNPPWEHRRTPDSRAVEAQLRPHFAQVDAYQFNPASIRLRIIDERFETLPSELRHNLVEFHLDQLPEPLACAIVILLLLAPSELPTARNTHFEQVAD